MRGTSPIRLAACLAVLCLSASLLPAPARAQITDGTNYDPTTKDWASVISACLKVGRIEKRIANFVTRSAFHDGLSVQILNDGTGRGIGGPDTSLFLTTAELMRPENTNDRFAATAGRVVVRIANFYNVSVADTLAVCGMAAAITNGNTVLKQGEKAWNPFTYTRLAVGRIDSTTPNPAGQLPPVEISIDNFISWWNARGFTIEEGSVLVTGSHSMVDEQLCFRGRDNNPQDYCDPFSESCRDIKMFQFDNHAYIDGCTPSLYLEDPSRVPKGDQFPPDPEITTVSDEEFDSIRAEEMCKFTSDVYRHNAIFHLDRQRRGLEAPDPPPKPSDDVFWENNPGKCISDDIENVRSNCPHGTHWGYTILDARLGKVCQESPQNSSFSELKSVMRKFAGDKLAMQKAYSLAYVKMVQRFANWAPKTLQILGRECPSGWVSKVGTLTDTDCEPCNDPRRACPYGCICATSFWNDVAVSGSLLDSAISPSPSSPSPNLPPISRLSGPGSVSLSSSSDLFGSTPSFDATFYQGAPKSPYWSSTKCPSRDGDSFDVDGFPASPFLITPFQDKHENPPVKKSSARACRTSPLADGGEHCMDAYEINVVEKQLNPFNMAIPACASKPTWFMTYDGIVPGPTIVTPAGTETLVRFNNKINGDFFATGQYPCNPKFGRPSGRPISIHLHGSPSLPPYDGWADDVTCTGESKDYIYPNSRATTAWYHDHALGITAPNAYRGMAAMYIITDDSTKGSKCKQPYNLDNMEEKIMMLSDKVLDSGCQLRYEKLREHRNNLYGDINMVNGIPWPVMNIEPKAYVFRFLNAGPSRPYLIRLRTRFGSNKHDDICKVIGGDGGYRQSASTSGFSSGSTFPSQGLYLGVAERYHVVCDFSSLAGQELYWTNDRDEKIQKNVPMFCFSHLLAKVVVGGSRKDPIVPFQPSWGLQGRALSTILTDQDISEARQMASSGKYHRHFKFGRRHGHWVINGDGWHNFKLAAADVGQNRWELWLLETGGSWFHPVHIHLVDFFILQRNDANGVLIYESFTPKDVVFMGPGQKIWAIARFGAHRGDYMFHCHNLVHEDDDMMRSFRTIGEGARFFNDDGPSHRLRGPLGDVLYSNWQYNNPMYPNVAAKPGLPAITEGFVKEMVNLNLYRIFYPTSGDGEFASSDNIWKFSCPAIVSGPPTNNPLPPLLPPPTPPPVPPPPPPTTCSWWQRLFGGCR